MRRTALIFGTLLTLMAGVWSGASIAASACCMHEAGAPVVSNEHDRCRAEIGVANERRTDSQTTSQTTSHDASHEESTMRAQSQATRAGVDCVSAGASSEGETGAAAFGRGGLSCAECCAGRSGHTPTTAVVAVSEQNRAKRDAGSVATGVRSLLAAVQARVSHFAPTQHAPPSSSERRHVLLSLFLI